MVSSEVSIDEETIVERAILVRLMNLSRAPAPPFLLLGTGPGLGETVKEMEMVSSLPPHPQLSLSGRLSFLCTALSAQFFPFLLKFA